MVSISSVENVETIFRSCPYLYQMNSILEGRCIGQLYLSTERSGKTTDFWTELDESLASNPSCRYSPCVLIINRRTIISCVVPQESTVAINQDTNHAPSCQPSLPLHVVPLQFAEVTKAYPPCNSVVPFVTQFGYLLSSR